MASFAISLMQSGQNRTGFEVKSDFIRRVRLKTKQEKNKRAAMNQKPGHLWTRLQRRRAFGEFSGSAELTEDRAVVERRLPAAGRSGTGR